MNVPLSASQITTYLLCARKYQLRYELGLRPEFKSAALAFGSAMHSAIDWWHAERIDGRSPDAAEVVRTFRSDWQSEQETGVRYDADENAAGFESLGSALLELYVARMAAENIVATEVPFEVPLVDPESGEVFAGRLRGYFDALIGEPGAETLVEVKTTARRFSAADLRRKVQFAAYRYAFRQARGRVPDVKVVALVKTKRPAIDVQDVTETLDERLFVRMAVEVGRAVDAGVFPANPGWACDGCEHGTACAAGEVKRAA